MTIFSFTYTKDDGEVTDRKVLRLHKNKDYLEGIDLGHLSDEEVGELKAIYKAYEEKLAPFMKKGFRRFSLSKMDKLEGTGDNEG